MKKCFLLLVVALILCGSVWGQVQPPVIPQAPFFDWGGFGWMNADTAESTESATSGGIFGSDIDSIVSVNGYNPEIGTFFFLGGGNRSSTPDNLNIDNDIDVDAGHISLGFATLLDAGYLGLYYGGNIVTAAGDNTDATKTTTSNYNWENDLVAMFGLRDGLSFRFDLHLSPDGQKVDVDDAVNGNISDDTRIAFTLGGFSLGDFASYVTLGFQFPEVDTTHPVDEDIKDIGTSRLGVQFGMAAESFYADALLDIWFASSLDGKSQKDGVFGIALDAGYAKTFEFGNFAFGFDPCATVYFGFPEKTFLFNLDAGVDLGLSYKFNEKFAIYSGASVRLFQWQALAVEDTGSNWLFNGIGWDPNGLIGVGLTFAPVPNVVIGADVSHFINRFIDVNPATLEVETVLTADNNTPNLGSWATSWFENLTFGLTISVKM